MSNLKEEFQELAYELINEEFGDLRETVILSQVKSSYATQGEAVTASKPTESIVLDYEDRAINGQSVQVGDRQVIVECQPVPFDVRADNVTMSISGVKVNVVSVKLDPAEAAYIIQVRKL